MTYFDMSQLSRGASAIGRMVQEHEERVAALEHDLIAALARAEAAEQRVAELEAALAAQQWRPVTITEPSPDFTVELIVVGYRGHDGYWHYPDGPEGLVIRGWRPVPPSVALREPTP